MRLSKRELAVIVSILRLGIRKEIIKKRSRYYSIGIYFTKYQKKEHKQYIHMVVYEADEYGKDGRNIILEECIEMKSWIYILNSA